MGGERNAVKAIMGRVMRFGKMCSEISSCLKKHERGFPFGKISPVKKHLSVMTQELNKMGISTALATP